MLSCTIGALAGSLLPVKLTGIEFSATAFFVSVVVNQWRHADSHIPVVTGFVSAAAVCLIALMTALARALPYLLFGGNREIPPLIVYLGGALPPAIMPILVVYCLRGAAPAVYPYSLPEAVSVALVAVAQALKKNTLWSILIGTACYMLLIRLF